VIGVLTPLSSSEQTSNNDLAVVPLTTYTQKLVGGVNRNSVSSIYVKATSSGALSAAYQETNALLLNVHKITTPTNADFSIATQQSILAASTSVDDTLTVMLAGIAVIALLVGGIGVMNIMLVSVTERYREIGLRMAVGASPKDILQQFLVEAVVLSVLGGAVGILAGRTGSVLIRVLAGWPTESSLAAIMGSVSVSVTIGIIFGYYPAWKASRLHPIEALRYE
jgi:ABC-type antimicrobial peptide transport system permease subunit